MDAVVTGVAVAAHAADGPLARLSLDKVIVQLPARRRIGVVGYAGYGRSMHIPPLINQRRWVHRGRVNPAERTRHQGNAARHRGKEACVILVIGAGSRTGQELVRLLRASAVPVRTLTRPADPAGGPDSVVGDLAEPATLDRAMADVPRDARQLARPIGDAGGNQRSRIRHADTNAKRPLRNIGSARADATARRSPDRPSRKRGEIRESRPAFRCSPCGLQKLNRTR